MSRSGVIKVWFLITLSASSFCASARDAAIAAEWNAAVLEVAEAEDSFLTLKGVRTVAMMHLAMHRALDTLTEDLGVAAVSEAALSVATDQYPDHREAFLAIRDRWLANTVGEERRAAAMSAGSAAARAVLDSRQGDGWDADAEYRWHPMAPGVYAEFEEHSGTPQGFIFGAGWAKARGFALARPDQFRAPPPPEIDSDAYAEAFNEVKTLGRFQSMRRTPDQTHIALWWKDFTESSHNRLARDLIEKEGLSLRAAVRLLALLNMAIFDGYVSSFDNKFHYNHWRPYTAIRWAEHDGNPNTLPEDTWTNTHRHTYAFPSYPSAHGTACAAAMTVLADVFGKSYAFEMRTPMVDVAGPLSGKIEMHPPTRRFDNFADAAMQCGLSRIYLGIHFRYDSIEGVKLGEKVGRNVLASRFAADSMND